MVATKRRFNPNLQRVRILVNGAPRRAYVCTRCLKSGRVEKARLGLALAGAALAALEASRARIDDLNVYPVPDGDTGTNMTLTVRAVVDALERDPDADIGRARPHGRARELRRHPLAARRRGAAGAAR